MRSPTKLYLMQRISGAMLVPTSVWILFFMMPLIGQIILGDTEIQSEALENIFGSIYHVSILIMFLLCGLYHGILGIRNIIYDYIKCSVMKKVAIFMLAIVSFATGVIGFIFILDAHISTISTQSSSDIAVISETISSNDEKDEELTIENNDSTN